MKTADQWLSEYAKTHQHPTNKRIHVVCVPLIFWSIVALMVATPWAPILMIPPLMFYFILGWRYGFVMLALTLISVTIALGIQVSGLNLNIVAISVFVVAWIGQFYGHKVEGKKPSFFEDILFLLIGPLWTLQPLLKKRS